MADKTARLKEVFINKLDHVEIVQPREDLYVIEQEEVQSLIDPRLIGDYFSLDELRHALKQAVKEKLALENRDIVFCLNGKIIIKKFVLDASTQERRFEGLPLEEIQSFVQKTFGLQTDILAQSIIQSVTKKELNFSRIDPFFFSKNFVVILQDYCRRIVQERLGEGYDGSVILGITNFLLRQHFDILLLGLAYSLLELVVSHDKNAESFIRHYSGEMVTDSYGHRKKLAEIRDEMGNKWNATSIMPILLQRKNGLIAIERQQQIIEKVCLDKEVREKKVEEFGNEIVISEEKNRGFNTDKQRIAREIDDNEKILRNDINPSQRGAINQRLRDLLKQETQINFKQKILSGEIVQLHKRIEMLQKESILFERKLEEEHKKKQALQKAFEPVLEKYEVIARALSKAMAKR